jgi:hypothetical protein
MVSWITRRSEMMKVKQGGVAWFKVRDGVDVEWLSYGLQLFYVPMNTDDEIETTRAVFDRDAKRLLGRGAFVRGSWGSDAGECPTLLGLVRFIEYAREMVTIFGQGLTWRRFSQEASTTNGWKLAEDREAMAWVNAVTRKVGGETFEAPDGLVMDWADMMVNGMAYGAWRAIERETTLKKYVEE